MKRIVHSLFIISLAFGGALYGMKRELAIIDETNQPTIKWLPQDILQYIVSYCWGSGKNSLAKVDKDFNATLKNREIIFLYNPISATLQDILASMFKYAHMNDTAKLSQIVPYTQYDDGINLKNSLGMTPFHIASGHKNKEMKQLLIEYGADINILKTGGVNPLHEAVYNNDIETVTELLDAKANPNISIPETDITSLHIACEEGHAHVVSLLLGAHANIGQTNEDGKAPLHFAAYAGNTDIVEQLIKAQADINQTDNQKHTPLFIAVSRGNTSVVELLIKAGANIEQKDDTDRTPLHCAASQRFTNSAYLLIKAGADLNQKDIDGRTPLFLAAINGDMNIIELLVQAKANIHIRDKEGWTALHAAIEGGYINIVKLLTNMGADINQQVNKGKPPFYSALRYSPETAQWLIQAGADVHVLDNIGNTPLHEVASVLFGRDEHVVELVKQLIAKKVDIHKTNYAGSTALHFACASGNLKAVEILLQAGAMTTWVNDAGKKPLDCAHDALNSAHYFTGLFHNKEACNKIIKLLQEYDEKTKQLSNNGALMTNEEKKFHQDLGDFIDSL
jgi:ankyrin repeat protein